MDRLGEMRRVEVIRSLVCGFKLLPGQICRAVMAYPGDPNIWMATPIGEKWPVYLVICPVNEGEEYCPGAKVVVFLPNCDDPDRQARLRAKPWLTSVCQVAGCRGRIDWDDYDELEEVGDDEIRYYAACQPKVGWLRRLIGLGKTRHNYVVSIVSIEEDDEDDDDLIPDRLPDSWLTPAPVA